jgi:D-inositol-3-phosphate glycosyltransferase
VDGFARAIERTLVDRLWAQKARKKSAQRVLTYFSWSGVAQQLSDLYKELLAEPKLLQTAALPAKVVNFRVS